VALLINEKPEDAITHLLRARDLGVTNRTVGFNLMLAYQQVGRTAEFEAEASNVQAVSTAEKLTAGIGFYKAGNYALSSELISSSLNELGEDRVRVSAAYRFIGHAESAIAEQLSKQNPIDQEAHTTRLNNAREAWRKAGNFHDYPAQRFFMAQETARSPQLAYDAGWQQLRWHNYQSLDGWKVVVGNYGAAITDGKGLAGMWQKNPVHLVVWGLLAIIPLCLALFAWLRPKPVESEIVTRPKTHSDNRPVQRPSTTPAKPAAKPQAKAPATRAGQPARPSPQDKAPAQRSPKTASNPPAAKSVPIPRQPTPKPPVRSQVETEATMKPARDPKAGQHEEPKRTPTSESLKPNVALERKRTEPDTNAALERRTPRPDAQN
jgi:hypothetical protein